MEGRIWGHAGKLCDSRDLVAGQKEEDGQHEVVKEMHKLKEFEVFVGGFDNDAAEEVMYGCNTSTMSLIYLLDASWLARKIISM